MCTIKNFVFIDLETTGLPYTENNQTKIIEISVIATTRDDLKSGNVPRVLNKLTLCLNPRRMISPAASNITGLWNDMLEEQKHFTSNTYDLLISFFQHLHSPICLIAHNGNNFDYPILSAELFAINKQLPDYVYCVDSIQAFKSLLIDNVGQDQTDNVRSITENKNIVDMVPNIELELNTDDNDDELFCTALTVIENDLDSSDQTLNGKTLQQIINETTPVSIPPPEKSNFNSTKSSLHNKHHKVCRRLPFSMSKPKSLSLANIYEFLMLKKPVDAHRAENDVMFLIECASKLSESFVDWCDKNAVLFSTIPRMEPGKRLGKK